MDRRFVWAWLAVGAVVMGGGCRSVWEEESGQNIAVEQLHIGEKLPAAFVQNDPSGFVAELPPELQAKFNADNFQTSRKVLGQTLGNAVSFRYLTQIEHPLLKVEVWAIRFERIGEDGRIIHQEALFRVISGTLDGKDRIISFNFL